MRSIRRFHSFLITYKRKTLCFFKTEVLLTGICCFYLQDGQISLFVDNFKKCIVYQSYVFHIRMIMRILYCKCVLYIDA